jgi:multidrug efflux pump subunit AcrA (membrane-fusion protein)
VNLLSHTSLIPLQLVLQSGIPYAPVGKVLFADRQVDQQTGTIRIAGAFPNPDNVLRPGQYGRVRAVTELQGSYEVAVVQSDNKVANRSAVTLFQELASPGFAPFLSHERDSGHLT